MPWQRQVLDVALEIDPKSGRLAYREVVLGTPRQSGKTTLLLALMAHRCLSFGGQQVVVYTAQDRNHALLKWQDEHVPTLQRSPLGQLFTVRRQRGAEALLWRTGSRWGITAPTETAGHGGTIDLAVADEAFARTDDRLEQGLGPAMVTRPEAQQWVVSTAGNASSTWLRGKVDAGRAEPRGRRTAYFEWSAVPDADPADPAVWRACMPALGYTVTEDTIRSEFEKLDLDTFRRSYLNIWADEAPRPEWLVIAEADWTALADPTSCAEDPLVLAVDATPERSWATIAAAGRRPDGLLHVEVVDHRQGVSWVPERLAGIVERQYPAAVIVDPGGPAGSLIPELEAAGIRITKPTARDAAGAAGALFDATRPDVAGLRHRGQTVLDAAVAGAVQRPLADAWAWSRRGSTVVVSPLVAASLAAWGVASAPGLQLFVA